MRLSKMLGNECVREAVELTPMDPERQPAIILRSSLAALLPAGAFQTARFAWNCLGFSVARSAQCLFNARRRCTASGLLVRYALQSNSEL